MNYLAHVFLSFDDPKLMIGQFIADDVKGKKYLTYSQRVSHGILLHRFVDHYTDTFPECLELRKEIREELGLFSGIAIDVYFDYMLSMYWSDFCETPREAFISGVYDVLDFHGNLMSEKRQFIYGKMKEQDWLSRYKSLEGIELTLSQMSGRISGGDHLLKATELLKKNEKMITEVFKMFFPKLISASKTKLDTFAT